MQRRPIRANRWVGAQQNASRGWRSLSGDLQVGRSKSLTICSGEERAIEVLRFAQDDTEKKRRTKARPLQREAENNITGRCRPGQGRGGRGGCGSPIPRPESGKRECELRQTSSR